MINDELKECKGCFEGNKDPFALKFTLKEEHLKTLLEVEVKNKNNRDYYHLTINDEYITEKPDLSFCFESAEDVFYTLMELFDQLRFQEGGALTFEMKLNATKLKKKIFTLNLIKTEVEEEKVVSLKLENLSRQMKQQMKAKEEKIRQLSRKNEEHETLIKQLKQESQQLRRQQQGLILQNKRQYFKISSLSKENQLQKQQFVTLKKKMESLLARMCTLQMYSFVENPHWHHFATVKTQRSYKIIRKDNDEIWYIFVYNLPLQLGKVNGFKMKQSRTNYRNVMYGIGTREVFGKDHAFKQKQSISYNANNGKIWEGGASRKGGAIIYDGQTVTVDINLNTNSITWTADTVKLGKAMIPQPMKKKQIYLFLHFYNLEDELELLLF